MYLKTLKTQVSNEHSSLLDDDLEFHPFSIEKFPNRKVPIHRLKALKYLKIEGICETLLYGNVKFFIHLWAFTLIKFKTKNIELHFESIFKSKNEMERNSEKLTIFFATYKPSESKCNPFF